MKIRIDRDGTVDRKALNRYTIDMIYVRENKSIRNKEKEPRIL